jgi:outer membrane receptor for ferrienterochelin and colicins
VCVSLLLMMLVQGPGGTLVVKVLTTERPAAGAQVIVNGQTFVADATGQVRLTLPAGTAEVTALATGFLATTASASVVAGEERSITLHLDAQPTIEEHITVSATRTDQRIEDLPMRVEVLGQEEVDEKVTMTPGDIVMMLNEMGGLRVQATSPSLGAASVRIQGMRGRYTRFLSDGLPLFGEQTGGLGLLQIPPTDLAQVEVIKGVASALYGAGALGGVVNLISKRSGPGVQSEVLVNRTTLAGTDAVLFGARPLSAKWSSTLLVGGHWQEKNDVDGDGWADMAGYSRAVIRPRGVWNNQRGDSLFVTTGFTWERRSGGTMPGAVLAATRTGYVEALDTARLDAGAVAQMLLAGRYVVTLRGAAATQRHDHQFGDIREDDRHDTQFIEAAVRGTAGRHTWVAGAAFERDRFDPAGLPQWRYDYHAPGVFAQDDVQVNGWLSVSVSGRLDAHNEFGTFFSPRASALVKGGGWTSRASVGGGFFAPTPLTDETEAAGLSRLRIDAPLRAETGRSASFDLTRRAGPVSITGSLFRSSIADPVIVDEATYTLANIAEATTNSGAELVGTFRRSPVSLTGTYTYVLSREGGGASRAETPLTPRHSAGLTGMWEAEGKGRVGLECYFTGRQRLENNPYREESAGYILFGGMVERQFGGIRVYVNAENLADVRQTSFDPLLRSTRAADGRWTVDAWAPLDGRVLNVGIRLKF